MKIVLKKISDLRSAGYNPRTMSDEQRKQLKESIERFGFQQPVIVNVHPKRNNFIIGGHQRIEIAKELGMEEVPCVEVNLSLKQEREFNVRLNKNTGEWDPAALEKFFNANELIGWGFTEKELDFDVSALIDKGKSNKEVRNDVTVAFQLGEIRFEISEADYVKWMDVMLAAGHKTNKQKIQCVKERLLLS